MVSEEPSSDLCQQNVIIVNQQLKQTMRFSWGHLSPNDLIIAIKNMAAAIPC